MASYNLVSDDITRHIELFTFPNTMEGEQLKNLIGGCLRALEFIYENNGSRGNEIYVKLNLKKFSKYQLILLCTVTGSYNIDLLKLLNRLVGF